MANPPMREVSRKRTSARAGGFQCIDEIALRTGSLPDDTRAASGFDRIRLCSAWRKAVGATLARASRPDSLSGVGGGSRLVVEVKDAQWKLELERLEPLIRGRVSRILSGQPVDRISFHVVAGMKSSTARQRPADPRRDRNRPAMNVGASLFDAPAVDLGGRFGEVMGRYLREKC